MLVWTSLVVRGKRRSLLSLSGIVLGALFFLQLARFYGWSLPWIVLGVVVGLFVVRSMGATVWFLSRHPFASGDLGLSEAAVPGGAVRCAVRILARRAVEIEKLQITLTAESRDSAGTTKRLFTDSRELLERTALPPGGDPLEAAAEIPLPEDAPLSYRSFEGRVRWLARARLEVSGYGAFEEEIEFLVAPNA